MAPLTEAGPAAAGDLAASAGGRLLRPPDGAPAPARGVVDSRQVRPGDLFLGVPGSRHDGGAFAPEALAHGAWGVMVAPRHAAAAARGGRGAVIEVEDPLRAGEALASARRKSLRGPVVAITGSNGKTTTKDLLAALLAERRVAATADSFNTRLGIVATLLGAPLDADVLVVEVGMARPGDVAARCAVVEPTAGVITNVGRAHLAGAGDLAGVAAAKAELLAALAPGATCVVPAGEAALAPHLREDLRTLTFGEGGDVCLESRAPGAVTIAAGSRRYEIEVALTAPHDLRNLLTAVAAVLALGESPARRPRLTRATLRGETVMLPGGATAVLDCFNANPSSMEAALVALAGAPARRRLAVLAAMGDLGERSPALHREVGERAAALGVDVLVVVGDGARAIGDAFPGPVHEVADPEHARALLRRIAGPGDRVLVKGSRDARLERIAGAGDRAPDDGSREARLERRATGARTRGKRRS